MLTKPLIYICLTSTDKMRQESRNILIIFFSLLQISNCLVRQRCSCVLRNRSRPDTSFPSPKLAKRKIQNSALVAAKKAKHINKIHGLSSKWLMKPAAAEPWRMRLGTERAWGGKEFYRTLKRRPRGWSSTGPTGGSVTLHTERLC